MWGGKRVFKAQLRTLTLSITINISININNKDTINNWHFLWCHLTDTFLYILLLLFWQKYHHCEDHHSSSSVSPQMVSSELLSVPIINRQTKVSHRKIKKFPAVKFECMNSSAKFGHMKCPSQKNKNKVVIF